MWQDVGSTCPPCAYAPWRKECDRGPRRRTRASESPAPQSTSSMAHEMSVRLSATARTRAVRSAGIGPRRQGERRQCLLPLVRGAGPAYGRSALGRRLSRPVHVVNRSAPTKRRMPRRMKRRSTRPVSGTAMLSTAVPELPKGARNGGGQWRRGAANGPETPSAPLSPPGTGRAVGPSTACDQSPPLPRGANL